MGSRPAGVTGRCGWRFTVRVTSAGTRLRSVALSTIPPPPTPTPPPPRNEVKNCPWSGTGLVGADPTRGPMLLAIMGPISTMVSEVRPELNRGPVYEGSSVSKVPCLVDKIRGKQQKQKTSFVEKLRRRVNKSLFRGKVFCFVFCLKVFVFLELKKPKWTASVVCGGKRSKQCVSPPIYTPARLAGVVRSALGS